MAPDSERCRDTRDIDDASSKDEELDRKQYLPHLDGIRGVSVLIVVFYHLGFDLASNGWLCISVFFSLSGLLVTGITVEAYEQTGSTDVVRFWSRRVGRLFPALLATILVVAVVSAWFLDHDATAAWYLRNDLLFALCYLENVNMAFWRKDDYFHAFQAPSPMRHIWTLSIEEQYYLAWPLLFLCCTSCLKKTEKGSSTTVRVSGRNSFQVYTILAIVMFMVMCASYISSLFTIRDLGVSAAYYSTWSRAGDFACGGLVYAMLRLAPAVYARYQHSEKLAPMSIQFRIFLESLFFVDILLLVLPPMIPLPLNVVLPIYFQAFRLPFGFLVIGLSVPGALQLSEPLPSWAVISRAMSSEFMTTVGMNSYGIYLVHWPLILWLGNPVSHIKSEQAIEPLLGLTMHVAEEAWTWSTLFRDWCVVFLSLAIGWVSFNLYEKPLMKWAAQKLTPWKVLAVGFASAGLCALLVVLLLGKAEDPHLPGSNAADQVAGSEGKDVLAVIGPKLDRLSSQMEQLSAAVATLAISLGAVNASTPPLSSNLSAFSLASRRQNEKLEFLCIGDSVSDKLCQMFVKHYPKCKARTAGSTTPFPRDVTFHNAAAPGRPCRLYFLPCSKTGFCQDAPKVSKYHSQLGPKVRAAMAVVKPDIVFLKDWQWPVAPSAGGINSFEDGLDSFGNFLTEAFSRQVRHVFTLTNGPWSKRKGTTVIDGDLRGQQSVLGRHPCEGGQQGMPVTIVHWHRLLCPRWNDSVGQNEQDCPVAVHGFDPIMKDKIHPSPDSLAGEWLMAQVLGGVLARFAQFDPALAATNRAWEGATSRIPPTACLFERYKPDSTQPLADLFETHVVCPPEGGWSVNDNLARRR